jgi:acyl carrier protein
MEPEVRRVVAEVLGVAPTELTAAVSLVDDLAADSLDLMEIGLGLEAAMGVSIPDQVLEHIRTYGDLVAALGRPSVDDVAFVETRVAPADERAGGVLQRAGWLTPYLTQMIADDARRAGRGARVDVRVVSSAASGIAALLERALDRVGARGAAVSVKRAKTTRHPESTDPADATDERTCTM